MRAKPKTYAEFKTREDHNREIEKGRPFTGTLLRVRGISTTPSDLLQVFFTCRYQGKSLKEIESLLYKAYIESEESVEVSRSTKADNGRSAASALKLKESESLSAMSSTVLDREFMPTSTEKGGRDEHSRS